MKGSGKGMWVLGSSGERGRAGKLIPRDSASMRTSRAVMTQSTSRTGWAVDVVELEDQWAEVSSVREASSFLSKQGIIARCHIWAGEMLRVFESTVLRRVPVSA